MTTKIIDALSISPAVTDWLVTSRQARVLHVFDRVCNLINEHREILSIVTPQIGNGPFNLVVEDELFSDLIALGSPISSFDPLIIGNVTVCSQHVRPWNPCPHWEMLHTKRDPIVRHIEDLQIRVTQPSGLSLESSRNIPVRPVSNLQFSSSLAAADLPGSLTAAKALAGLGPGLTPAGDDFIMGALYAVWIIHPPDLAMKLAQEIANTAALLTTSLSSAWIRSAGRGEAGILWHTFFHALGASNHAQTRESVDKILGVGATSGADALAGFIGTLISYAELQRKHVIP